MNCDIDLRSARYIASTYSLKTGAVRLILALFLLFLPFALFYALTGYKNHLEETTAALETELAALTLSAEPLIAMKAEIEQARQIAELKNNLKNRRTPLPSFIQKLRASVPHTLKLNSIVINPDKSIEITGTGLEMQGPALYRQSIANLSFTGHTELKSVSMNPQGGYSFMLKTVLIIPEEADHHEN